MRNGKNDKEKNALRVLFYERAGVRTPDNLIKSQVLYQLSYTPLLTLLSQRMPSSGIELGGFSVFVEKCPVDIFPKIRKTHILPKNAQFRNRTRDTRIFSPLLYQLS